MGPRPAKSQVSIIAPGDKRKSQMNTFGQVSDSVLWILLAIVASICLVVLLAVSYLYATLVNKDPHPLEQSMKKLGVTLVVGLRNMKLKNEEPPVVAEEAVKLPDHIKDSEKTLSDLKIKFYALIRKPQKSGKVWHPFGNGLYYVSQGKKTWYEAENFCMSRKAHLTSVLSSEEQNYVTSQLTQPAWIGLTDGGRGRWEWTDGSRLVAQFWSQGQPGHSEHLGDGDQGCTIIVPSSKGDNWNVVDCNRLNRWVCKGTHKIHQTH
ncbi:C-type lectin domain family 4 member M-like [Erythrolamprus reginae]|uniref:C-type lectin domain family 4 member M-like n=1 Tax=Erythrolamprus reginae TaxID=121349 RepID=UPI00396C3222